MITAIIFVVIIVIAIGAMIMIYNRITRLLANIHEHEKQIEAQLDHRYKHLESLITVTNSYVDDGKNSLKEIIALRQAAQAAKASGDMALRNDIESKISNIAANIKLIFEVHPQLKANQQALQLQEKIIDLLKSIRGLLVNKPLSQGQRDKINQGLELIESALIDEEEVITYN